MDQHIKSITVPECSNISLCTNTYIIGFRVDFVISGFKGAYKVTDLTSAVEVVMKHYKYVSIYQYNTIIM